MISFVAEKDQRIYEIIKTLFHAAQPITITSLADITNASICSIKYDLNDLKEILKPVDGKLISSFEGITLALPTNVGLDYF